MKAIKYLLIGISFLAAFGANAQTPGTIKLSSHPQWGLAGYSNIRYYYLPDIECYYDIQSSRFIYFNGVDWVHKANLPLKHRNYDLYRGYKVVLNDYRGDKPYSNFHEYKIKYVKGYRGQEQKNIGDKQSERNANFKVESKNVRHDDGRSNSSEKRNKKGRK